MLENMSLWKRAAFSIAFAGAHLTGCQQPLTCQRISQQNVMLSSAGYKPPILSLNQLLESDHAMNDALMNFARTGDKATYRAAVFKAAQQGDLAAEMVLGEQYIPEQCFQEPNQDVPHCGKNGNEPPHVVFRTNPLGIDASYEDACTWLRKASDQGSGEASEILAQLITRMRANGHGTHYTEADSARFHALARSQGFDVELILVTCYKLVPGPSGITVGRLTGFIAGDPPDEPFSAGELKALKEAGVSGSLLYGGGTGWGESALLTRPEGPAVRVRIILDHQPGSSVLLPMPAHHDAIYVQRGDQFLAFPNGGKVLPRAIGLEPQMQDTAQVSVSTQQMDGAFAGGFCTRFP